MKHPNKEINTAIKYAESKGWRIEKCNGHAWGKMLCPNNDSECRCGQFCIQSIWSTPKNPENFAKQIRQVVDHCLHQESLKKMKKLYKERLNDERL